MCCIWDALSALGTFAAVITSLWIAHGNRKKVKKLEIYQQFTQCFGSGMIKLIITLENVGNTPIIINEYGRAWDKKGSIMKDINKYLVSPYEPILIKANEAKIIEYQYRFGHSFEAGDCTVEGSREFELFSKAIFRASDTLGNSYSPKF